MGWGGLIACRGLARGSSHQVRASQTWRATRATGGHVTRGVWFRGPRRGARGHGPRSLACANEGLARGRPGRRRVGDGPGPWCTESRGAGEKPGFIPSQEHEVTAGAGRRGRAPVEAPAGSIVLPGGGGGQEPRCTKLRVTVAALIPHNGSLAAGGPLSTSVTNGLADVCQNQNFPWPV